jgi:glycine oxidase
MPVSPDVIVIGAGAIGGAVALALAQRGLAVSVLESGRIGRGASWAAAGVLAPDWSGHDHPALTQLAADSLAMWPEWAADLELRSGVALSFRRDGLLNVQADPEMPSPPPELGFDPPPLASGERLSAGALRRHEPVISGPIVGGVLDAEVAQVDNARLAPALMRATELLGASVREGTAVVGLERVGQRCVGVRLADGALLSGGAVVLAAGAWSGPLAQSMGISLPMVPYRGQMLLFDTLARPLRRIVFCGELVLIPRAHGPLIVGTTYEHAGFDCRVTLGGIAQILARATRIVPGLADLPLAKTWAGLRPGTPDGLPHMGPVPGWDNLFVATGHGRKGIILAPLTGEVMAELIVDGDVDARLAQCLPDRKIGTPLQNPGQN